MLALPVQSAYDEINTDPSLRNNGVQWLGWITLSEFFYWQVMYSESQGKYTATITSMVVLYFAQGEILCGVCFSTEKYRNTWKGIVPTSIYTFGTREHMKKICPCISKSIETFICICFPSSIFVNEKTGELRVLVTGLIFVSYNAVRTNHDP